MIEQILVHGIVFVAMLFLYITAFSFPALNIGGNLGAAWWPQLVLVCGMILTAVSAFLSVKKLRAGDEKAKKKISKREISSLAFSFAILAVTLLLINVAGFIGSIPILVVGFMFQLGCRKPLSLVLASAITTLVFALLFGRVMAVSLPRGLGIMRSLSFYIY
jgi:cytochrome b561